MSFNSHKSNLPFQSNLPYLAVKQLWCSVEIGIDCLTKLINSFRAIIFPKRFSYIVAKNVRLNKTKRPPCTLNLNNTYTTKQTLYAYVFHAGEDTRDRLR